MGNENSIPPAINPTGTCAYLMARTTCALDGVETVASCLPVAVLCALTQCSAAQWVSRPVCSGTLDLVRSWGRDGVVPLTDGPIQCFDQSVHPVRVLPGGLIRLLCDAHFLSSRQNSGHAEAVGR